MHREKHITRTYRGGGNFMPGDRRPRTVLFVLCHLYAIHDGLLHPVFDVVVSRSSYRSSLCSMRPCWIETESLTATIKCLKYWSIRLLWTFIVNLRDGLSYSVIDALLRSPFNWHASLFYTLSFQKPSSSSCLQARANHRRQADTALLVISTVFSATC